MQGLDGKNSATLTMGRPGVLHGTRTYLQQDQDGQILETHSISAGTYALDRHACSSSSRSLSEGSWT